MELGRLSGLFGTDRRKWKIKISGRKFFYYICLFCIFEPEFFSTNKWVHYAVTLMRVFILAVLFFEYWKQHKFPKIVAACLPYYLILLFTTWYNGISWQEFAPEMMLNFLVLFWGAREIHKNQFYFIDTLYRLFWCYIVANEVYILLNPWTEDYAARGFMGGKNAFGPFSICVILVALTEQYLANSVTKRKDTYVLIILTIIQVFQLNSTTGVVGIVVFVGTLLLFVHRKMEVRIFKFYLTGYAVLFWMVIFVRIQERFAEIIYQLTGKDATFTARTYLWDRAVELINARPWIGYGTGELIRRSGTNSLWAAHNGILDILLIGGIPLLTAYVFYLLYCAHRAEQNSGYISQICMAAWFAFSIMLLTEYYEMNVYFLLITLIMYYADRFEQGRIGKVRYGRKNTDNFYSDL